MQRRKFLSAATAATTLAVSGVNAKIKASDKKGFIVKNGDARFGVHTPMAGVNPNDTKISSKDTDGQLSVFEYIGTQKIGPPLHLHFNQDEVFYVIEGEYIFQLDKEQSTLKAGDTIFLPRNVPHTWVQLTDKGKLIYSLQPSGQFEEFFLKFSAMKELPSPEEMQKFFMAHGMQIMGPPLSAK